MPLIPLPQSQRKTPVQSHIYDGGIFEEYIRRTYTNRNTRNLYLSFFHRIEPFLVEGNITEQTINRFLTSISDNPSYGNPFYQGALKAIKRCYNLDFEIPKVRSAKPYKNKPKFLSYDEVAEIVRNIQNHQIKVMVRLYFETGLRQAELIHAGIRDIDLEKRTISGIGKWNQHFAVKFSPGAKKWLEEWFGKATDPEHPFVLYGKQSDTIGRPLRNQGGSLYYYLNRECRRMGKEGIHVHRFRHALGHFLRADKGFDLAEVKTKLRHRSITSTEIYAPATQEEVDKKIDREVFGAEID